MPEPRPRRVLPPPVALASFVADLESDYFEDWIVESSEATVVCFVDSQGARPSIVVKHGLPLRDDPAEVAATLLGLETGPGDVTWSPIAPKLVAYGADPSFVAYEFIEGRLVNDVIEDAVGGPSADIPGRLIDVARQTGATMARFHRVFGPPGPHDRSYERLSRSRLVTGCLHLGGVRLPEYSTWVRSMVDPGPHNLVLDRDDQVMIIDLSGEVVFRPREAEVGMLAHRFGRKVRGKVRSAGSSTRGVGRRMAGAVVGGYEQEHEQPLDPKVIEAFVAVSGALCSSIHGPSARSITSARDAASDVAWCIGALVRARRANHRPFRPRATAESG